MTEDLLAGAGWECLAVEPGGPNPFSLRQPGDPAAPLPIPAVVPGTAAAALHAAEEPIDNRDFDGADWWYRARFDGPPIVTDAAPRPFTLICEGLATIADVWLNGEHLLHSENMFRPQSVDLHRLEPSNELLIRFASLTAALSARRPRPRWKVARLASPRLPWFRTTLLGRLTGWPDRAAAVGPWRPITLRPAAPAVHWRRLRAEFHDGAGWVDVEIHADGVNAHLVLADRLIPLDVGAPGVFTVRQRVADVKPWWPHTHGAQPLYPLAVVVDGITTVRSPIGFRTVTVDRTGGKFAVQINGKSIFCRGAHWTPLDLVSLSDSSGALDSALQQVRRGSMNMIRIGGETVYPTQPLLDLCDELGLMVWQDCMFAYADVPDADALQDDIAGELTHQIAAMAGHPSVVMISGGSEIEQQAAFYGVPFGTALTARHHRLLPELAERIAGLPSVTSTPSGGRVPTDPRVGVSHYFGVGAYLRELGDARRADVQFAAECLSFANPPERVTVDEYFGGPAAAGHHPDWKRAVYRDAGASWDFEDVLLHYVGQVFGDEAMRMRPIDPDRALDLARAASATVFTETLTEWRRPGSSCSGALVFHHHDALPGAGLGIVDALGRPKSPWYAMRRAMAPVTVLVTDEGLAGLDCHLFNDTPATITAQLRVDLYSDGELCVESAERPVTLPAGSASSCAVSEMFDGFRDLNHAHHFGAAPYELVVITLTGAGSGVPLGRAVFTPAVPRLESDVGLSALARTTADRWMLDITTRRFAHWVSVDAGALIPGDSWFHLPPGTTVTVDLGPGGAPSGTVRALNSVRGTRIALPPNG